MKAISVRQPWAWGIIYSTKDVENRGWPINYRGDILIHTAKTCTKKEYHQAQEFCQSMSVSIPELKSLRLEFAAKNWAGFILHKLIVKPNDYPKKPAQFFRTRLRVGQIIGIVTIVNCQFSQVASGWGMPGQYHWQLENPREITPIPYIGQLGIFEVPLELVQEAIAL